MKAKTDLPAGGGRRGGRTRYPIAHPSYLLLLIPFIALLWPSSYAHLTPALWGFPYFYWYQFMWLIIGAILTQVVFVLARGGS